MSLVLCAAIDAIYVCIVCSAHTADTHTNAIVVTACRCTKCGQVIITLV
jgi:DNA-directed RNA polymerase subunit RPC12/RpoP